MVEVWNVFRRACMVCGELCLPTWCKSILVALIWMTNVECDNVECDKLKGNAAYSPTCAPTRRSLKNGPKNHFFIRPEFHTFLGWGHYFGSNWFCIWYTSCIVHCALSCITLHQRYARVLVVCSSGGCPVWFFLNLFIFLFFVTAFNFS